MGVCLQKLYASGNVGVILSAYYVAGVFGQFNIVEMLGLMFARKDIPGFLKQAYRFGIYRGLEEQIEQAIRWHEDRQLPDAKAWRLKFEKLVEQVQLAAQSTRTEAVQILQEEDSLVSKQNIYVELKPIAVPPAKPRVEIQDPIDGDPYIVSQVSRRKVERANQQHSATLAILTGALRDTGCEVNQTRLIDAFSVVRGRTVIFEVKSITEENEREQTRHAISQLYEYRFLYSMKDAVLCLVFSQQPFSQWLVDYLTQDRSIHVLWVDQGRVRGVSLSSILGE